jgi:hypothetical protein
MDSEILEDEEMEKAFSAAKAAADEIAIGQGKS